MSMLQLSVWQHEVVILPKRPVPDMHLDEHDWTVINSDDFKYFSFLKFKIKITLSTKYYTLAKKIN